MKRIFCLLFFLLFFGSVNSQNWKWLNPLPQGNSLKSVNYLGSGKYIAAGFGGSIVKSENGGTNWTMQNSANYVDINRLVFVNQNIAYAAGYDGKVIKSTDGGTNWNNLTSGTTEDIYGLGFINQDTGYLVGDYTMIKKNNQWW